MRPLWSALLCLAAFVCAACLVPSAVPAQAQPPAEPAATDEPSSEEGSVDDDAAASAPGDAAETAVPTEEAAEPAPAAETTPRSVEHVATPPPAMMFDRIDEGAGVWRLDARARTGSSETPSDPYPVYVQFGFMSCLPCHELASIAQQALRGRVELVYVHLDDIEMGTSLDPTPTWEQLRVFLAEREEYEGFIGLIRGNTRMMHLLTGPGNPPHAMLIHPDGRHTLMRSPTPEVARAAFSDFVEAAGE